MLFFQKVRNSCKNKLRNNLIFPAKILKEGRKMKVRPSVKPMCEKCKVIKREGKVMVICPKNKSHKQTQG